MNSELFLYQPPTKPPFTRVTKKDAPYAYQDKLTFIKLVLRDPLARTSMTASRSAARIQVTRGTRHFAPDGLCHHQWLQRRSSACRAPWLPEVQRPHSSAGALLGSSIEPLLTSLSSAPTIRGSKSGATEECFAFRT